MIDPEHDALLLDGTSGDYLLLDGTSGDALLLEAAESLLSDQADFGWKSSSRRPEWASSNRRLEWKA